MKKFVLIKIFMIILASISLHSNVLADSEQMTKWLDDEDIRTMVKERLGDRVYIAPAIPDWPELMRDIASLAMLEVRSDKIALIPININNSHWTALALRSKADGTIVALYNDSLGHPISYSNMSGKYLELLEKLIPDIEVMDLQTRQQDDGFSCGLFTARNLIAFALLDQKDLTIRATKEELEKIKEQVKKENEVDHAK